MTRNAPDMLADVPLERRTLPGGTVVLRLPPRGAARIFLDESQSFLIVIGLGGTVVWAGWYAQSFALALGGGAFFALLLLAAVVRSIMLIRADRSEGTHVAIDDRTLRLTDFGEVHTWDLREICHVAAGAGTSVRCRLIVRTADDVDEVLRFRTPAEIHALAAEIRKVLAAQLGVATARGARRRQDNALHTTPPGRPTTTRTSAGETVIELGPLDGWRRVSPFLAGILVLGGLFLAAALLPWRTQGERLYACLIIGAVLLLVVGAAVRAQLNPRRATVRLDARRLSVVRDGSREQSWVWSEIADVDVGPEPGSDSSTSCLLVRCIDRIDTALQGEGPSELQWLACVIRDARPPDETGARDAKIR